MAESEFVGVDACTGGWVSVGLNSGGKYELKAFFFFDEVLAYYESARLILVDIPIGLFQGAGRRICDQLAKTKLGKISSSVFWTPTRQILNHLEQLPQDYRTAYKAARKYELKFTDNEQSISSQAFGILPKIAEVDKVMLERKRNGEAIPEIREVHPEICFWALKGGKELSYKKNEKGEKGIEERIDILKGTEIPGLDADELFKDGRIRFRWRRVGDDDILDAFAAAVTAYKVSMSPNQLWRLPANPPTDVKCLPMEMVYWIPP